MLPRALSPILQRLRMLAVYLALSCICKSSLAASTPGEAINLYLENLISNSLQLEQTAISPFCSEKKKAEIEEKISKLKNLIADRPAQLGEEKAAFEILRTLKEEDLAVVIVSYRSAGRPFQVQIQNFPIIKQDDSWLVAPMPGSFQNSLIGFDEERKARSKALLKKADKISATMAEQETNKILQLVERKLNEAKSQLPDPQASFFDRLLSLREALRAGNLFLAMCHFPEGLEVRDDDLAGGDFTKRYLYLAASIAPESDTPLAEYFISPACASSPGLLTKRENDAELTVFHRSFWESYRFQTVFEFTKIDGVWVFDIPSQLEEGADRNRWMMEREQNDMTEKFGASALETSLMLRSKIPAYQSAEALADQCAKLMGSLNFEEILLLSERRLGNDKEGNLTASSESAAFSLLAQLIEQNGISKNPTLATLADRIALSLRSANIKRGQKIISVRLLESGNLAKWYWVNMDPGVVEAQSVNHLNFVKHGDAWFIARNDQTEELASRNEELLALKLPAKTIKQEAERKIMEQISIKTKVIDPTDLRSGKAEELDQTWKELVSSLNTKPLAELYEKCAFIKGSLEKRPGEALADMANVMRGIKFDQRRFEKREVSLVGPLGVVSLSIANKERGPRSPYYLFAMHEGSWRLLPQLQLEPAKNIGRKLLNKRVWQLIESSFEPEIAEQIRKSYEEHVVRLPVDEDKAP